MKPVLQLEIADQWEDIISISLKASNLEAFIMTAYVANYRPYAVVQEGEALGYRYVVMYNYMLCYTAYVKLYARHPWVESFGEEITSGDYHEIPVEVHGGITYCARDQDEPDSYIWIGYDFSHANDAPDPMLRNVIHRQIEREEDPKIVEKLKETIASADHMSVVYSSIKTVLGGTIGTVLGGTIGGAMREERSLNYVIDETINFCAQAKAAESES